MSREAADALIRAHPAFAPLVEQHGVIALEPRELSPYEALCRHIVYQQLSGKAAGTIYGRFAALFGGDGPPPPDQLAQADLEHLRSAGLSRNKTLALIDLAKKICAREVPDRETCQTLDGDEVIKRLTDVRGVGVWTAQMFLLFTLARPDIWPTGDLGVRQGWRKAAGLDTAPSPAGLADIGQAFKPWRSYAALYLWRAADTPDPAAKGKAAG